MRFSENKTFVRWLLILASFVIISLILWNTYSFFQHFKEEERIKMENWTLAQKKLLEVLSESNENDNINEDTELALTILGNNLTTPMLVVDKNKNVSAYNNIGFNTVKDSIETANNIEDFTKSYLREHLEIDSIYLSQKQNEILRTHTLEYQKRDSVYLSKNVEHLIQKFSRENVPISIGYEHLTLYYGNSPLLNKLKYYPLALLLIIFLFAAVVYFYYKSTRTATQNKLWSGMAKETAHQIGTPLSSLIGWTEILKSEQVNHDHINEIEKDITRLQTITDRFSKIGSVPKLKKINVVTATKEAYHYLQLRSSKYINYEFATSDEVIFVNLNEQLYSWTIENVVKNAIDAMKGKGKLNIEIIKRNISVDIHISDTGKGMSKSQYKKIFDPGFTSKKRGWGLGLSLSKRIIEDYHQGKIKVLTSDMHFGTTMLITLKLA